MGPEELLGKAHELERRSNDGRRYQYDREAAARELVELVPEVLDVLRDLLLLTERLESVAKHADQLHIAVLLTAPVSCASWVKKMRPLRELRKALNKLEEIR